MKRRLQFIATILLLISLLPCAGCKNDDVNNAEQKMREELEMAYEKQNVAFCLGYELPEYSPQKYAHLNVDGIHSHLYIDIAYFNIKTGGSFRYDQVVDYLSKEYEDDGEICIFTNGRHPEVAEYVEWVWEHEQEMREYEKRIERIYYDYYYATDGFETDPMFEWPTEIIDELIKKEADPDYEMDLMEIQERRKKEAGE